MIVVSGNTYPLRSFLLGQGFKYMLGKEKVYYKGMMNWYEKTDFMEKLQKEKERLGIKEDEIHVEED